jgi:hypothetical protein
MLHASRCVQVGRCCHMIPAPGRDTLVLFKIGCQQILQVSILRSCSR